MGALSAGVAKRIGDELERVRLEAAKNLAAGRSQRDASNGYYVRRQMADAWKKTLGANRSDR